MRAACTPGLHLSRSLALSLSRSLAHFEPLLPGLNRRAMFGLRNNGSEEAVLALVDGFQDSSALFRHEIGSLHQALMYARECL